MPATKRLKTKRSKRKTVKSVKAKDDFKSAKHKRLVSQSSALIQSLQGEDALLLFTDGACFGTPKKWGAGIILQRNVSGPSALLRLGFSDKQSHTNQYAELMGIWGALFLLKYFVITRNLLPTPNTDPKPMVYILTDSKYARGMTSLNWKAECNVALVNHIRTLQSELQYYLSIHVEWIKAHVNLWGNEQADRMANIAAHLKSHRIESHPLIDLHPTTSSSNSSMSKSKGKSKRQKQMSPPSNNHSVSPLSRSFYHAIEHEILSRREDVEEHLEALATFAFSTLNADKHILKATSEI